jgi:hypothetical protein
MKDDHAQALIDLAVVGLGAVAVVYIMRTPPLRRALSRALKYGLFTAAPNFVWQEVTKAWAESGTRIENLE